MKRLIAHIKRWYRNFSKVLLYPFHAYSFVGEMLENGGYIIRTDFEHQGESFTFRTIVQLDGSITAFIPPLHGYYKNSHWISNDDDPKWQGVFRRHYRLQQEKTESFLQSVSRQVTFWERGAELSIGIINLYSLYKAFSEFNIWLLFWVAASSLYVFLFGNHISGLIMKVFWWILKVAFVKRLRKNFGF